MKARALSLPVVLGLALGACDDHPPVVRNCHDDAAVPCPNQNDRAARIEGTLTYQGPAPSVDANGVPTGRVVLLLFDAHNPPAPEGTATTALSFQTISAGQLFQAAAVLPGGQVRASTGYSFPGITRLGGQVVAALYLALAQPWPKSAAWIPLAILASFARLLVAYVLALAWTVPIAAWAADRPRVLAFVQPLSQVGASVPATALFPLFIAALARHRGGMEVASV
ncbi:MAG: hypothetical protein WCJ30_12985, partial [Deltaproteobacteria bacterium]